MVSGPVSKFVCKSVSIDSAHPGLTPVSRPPNPRTFNFSPQISAGPAGTLRDHSYPPKGLQITGHNAIGPCGRYHLTRSSFVTASKEITADADPQATTSPSPLVLDLTTMSVVVSRKLGPKSDAENLRPSNLGRPVVRAKGIFLWWDAESSQVTLAKNGSANVDQENHPEQH